MPGEHDASAMHVFVKGTEIDLDYTDNEKQYLDLVSSGPLSALRATKFLGVLSHKHLPVNRLENCGAIKRSSLTPTDIMHVTGQFNRWDAEASRRALTIWSAMFGKPPEEALKLVSTAITRRLFEEIIRRDLSYEDKHLRELSADWLPLLKKAFSGGGSGMQLHFDMLRPVVAVGAPARVLVPPVAKHLSAKIIIPEDGDVANAVGAVGSDVVASEKVLIKPAQDSSFIVHTRERRLEFRDLKFATDKALEVARACALKSALEAGAIAPSLIVHCNWLRVAERSPSRKAPSRIPFCANARSRSWARVNKLRAEAFLSSI